MPRFDNTDEWTEIGQCFDEASSLEPIPPGEYLCSIDGALGKNHKGTPSYKVKLTVLEGEHAGRLLFRDFFLTHHATPLSKRELARIGLTTFEQLKSPLPELMRVLADVKLITNDPDPTGNISTFNKIDRLVLAN